MEAETGRPLRLLVLGSSDALGVGLAKPDEEAWPIVLQRLLSDRYGDVDCVRRMFISDAPTSQRFLEDQLTRYPADWVVLHTSAIGLTIQTVPYRVANLFGARAGRLATRLVRDADRVISRDTRPGRRANLSLRWLARRIIGVDSRTRYQPLVDGYMAVIARIARLETNFAMMGTGQPHSAVGDGNPKCRELVEKFNRDMAIEARRRRIAWAEHDLPGQTPQERDALFNDLVHKNADWHRLMAHRVLAALDPTFPSANPAHARTSEAALSRSAITAS